MAVLDDVSAQLHGVKEGADQNLKGKLSMALSQNEYFDDSGVGFRIHHYAGTHGNNNLTMIIWWVLFHSKIFWVVNEVYL